MKNTRLLFAFISLALSATGSIAFASGNHAGGHHHDVTIGQPGKPGAATRTVTLDMNDMMRFNPAYVQVSQGETIRFVIKNIGKVKHEFVLGTPAALREHYEVMKKFPEMEHADPNMVTVAPGQTGEVIWQFSQAGKIGFACLQPGHYDAGMKGTVMVMGKKMRGREGKSMGSHANHQH